MLWMLDRRCGELAVGQLLRRPIRGVDLVAYRQQGDRLCLRDREAAVALLGSTKTKLTQHDLHRLSAILEQAKKESAK